MAFTNIVNFFTSSWPSVGIGGGGSKVVKSLTSNSHKGSIGNITNGLKASEAWNSGQGCFGASDPRIKELLQNYPLTNLFLNIYTSIIGDIITKTSFDVKVENCEDNLLEDINNYIKEINFQDFIRENLRESLYWGAYASPIFINEKTRKFKLGEFIHSERLIPAFYNGELKYYCYKDDEKGDITSGGTDDIITIPADEVVYLGFDMHRKFPVVLDKEGKTGLKKIVVNVVYRFPMGIFDDCLYLLYNHLLNTYIKQLLTLKNALRPDVIMARQIDQDPSVTDSTDDIENIEACLNNNESGVVMGLFGDPSAVLTNITSSILNQLKVVPSLTNYSDFELIQFPTLEEKIAKLNDDLQITKLQIGNQLGIPEELLNSNSNRWEVVSRSATFQHAINKRLSDISKSLKNTVYNYCKKYHNIEIKHSDISITFDTNNMLFNAEYLQKQALLNDKLDSMSRMFANISQIKEDPNINRFELDKWARAQLSTLDPDLEKIVIKQEVPKLMDPRTGAPIPEEAVIQMMQNGQIDQFGNPIMPPQEGEGNPEEGY